MPQPEQQARTTIDALLTAAGWHVCDVDAANIHAASRLAKTETNLAHREGCSFEADAQLLQRILETRRARYRRSTRIAGGVGVGDSGADV